MMGLKDYHTQRTAGYARADGRFDGVQYFIEALSDRGLLTEAVLDAHSAALARVAAINTAEREALTIALLDTL
jgi:hypothetical protein